MIHSQLRSILFSVAFTFNASESGVTTVISFPNRNPIKNPKKK